MSILDYFFIRGQRVEHLVANSNPQNTLCGFPTPSALEQHVNTMQNPGCVPVCNHCQGVLNGWDLPLGVHQ